MTAPLHQALTTIMSKLGKDDAINACDYLTHRYEKQASTFFFIMPNINSKDEWDIYTNSSITKGAKLLFNRVAEAWLSGFHSEASKTAG